MMHLKHSDLEKAEYVNASEVPVLKRHLQKWIQVVKDYHDRVEPPWRYRERTQVGFFAAASWLCDVPCLEEWSLAKGSAERPIRGRCDLWIKTGDYHIEAKHKWCNACAKKPTSIQAAVNHSVESAERISGDHPRLSFTFLAPYIPPRQSIATSVSGWLTLLKDSSVVKDCAAIAWYLPERKPGSNDSDGNYGFGLVLLVHKL